MIIDTLNIPVSEQLAPWRELALKLRAHATAEVVQDGADAIEMLCLACEEYARRAERDREYRAIDRADADAQLSDAVAELDDARRLNTRITAHSPQGVRFDVDESDGYVLCIIGTSDDGPAFSFAKGEDAAEAMQRAVTARGEVPA